VAKAWQSGGVWRPAGVALAGLFLASHWPAARFAAKWWYERSMRIENIVRAVSQVRQSEPRKTILLTGVDETIFTGAFRDKAFTAVGVDNVYLDPDASAQLPAELLRAAPAEFALDPAIIRRLLNRNQLVVLSLEKEPLRKITRAYTKQFLQTHPEDELPRRIETGAAVAGDLFGPTWGPAEFGFRWMPRHAKFRINGPTGVGQRIHLTGHNPEEQARNGPLRLSITVDGRSVGNRTLTKPGGFDLSYPLPDELVGRAEVEVSLEVDRTFRPPADGRDLGLVFTVFEVR
jgi:hypothetical protein